MAGDVQRFYIESSKTNTPESLRGTTYKSPPSAIPAEVGKIWICEPQMASSFRRIIMNLPANMLRERWSV